MDLQDTIAVFYSLDQVSPDKLVNRKYRVEIIAVLKNELGISQYQISKRKNLLVVTLNEENNSLYNVAIGEKVSSNDNFIEFSDNCEPEIISTTESIKCRLRKNNYLIFTVYKKSNPLEYVLGENNLKNSVSEAPIEELKDIKNKDSFSVETLEPKKPKKTVSAKASSQKKGVSSRKKGVRRKKTTTKKRNSNAD